ncbi:Uncharacterised protein [Mycoplasmopsis citelli]|uniref:Uncharacterized protein n=1 Tax=Mycoplasmopsis citelli TaxID=171281 RepID=A0A449B167_9BACT|nr:hypothetical protein [Mycoplasmopsis citelli]VEU74285.1 Uncharacterised protein [Mycoplasmopsis citelli]
MITINKVGERNLKYLERENFDVKNLFEKINKHIEFLKPEFKDNYTNALQEIFNYDFDSFSGDVSQKVEKNNWEMAIKIINNNCSINYVYDIVNTFLGMYRNIANASNFFEDTKISSGSKFLEKNILFDEDQKPIESDKYYQVDSDNEIYKVPEHYLRKKLLNWQFENQKVDLSMNSVIENVFEIDNDTLDLETKPMMYTKVDLRSLKNLREENKKESKQEQAKATAFGV